jgi:hypothetical protein
MRASFHKDELSIGRIGEKADFLFRISHGIDNICRSLLMLAEPCPSVHMVVLLNLRGAIAPGTGHLGVAGEDHCAQLN